MPRPKIKSKGFTPLRDKSLTGFTMVEMLVAIFVLLVGITGGMAAIVKVITLTSVASSKLTAAYLAQEGLELVRNIRDTNALEYRRDGVTTWDEGLLNCGSGCVIDYLDVQDNKPDLPAYDSNNPPNNPLNRFLYFDESNYYNRRGNGLQTKFQRKITINKPSNDILNVTVEVMWTDRGALYTVTAQEQLYNWQ